MTKSETIVSKLMSGRFWCILLITATACYMSVIEPSIRDAFFALAGGVIRDYFTRSDRKEEIKPKEEVK